MGYKRCSKAVTEEFQTQGHAIENALFSKLILVLYSIVTLFLASLWPAHN